VPPGIPGHLPDVALPYDPDRARQLLAEAGYPGGEGFPPVSWLTVSCFRDAAENLQGQWRDILGLETKWRIMETAEMLPLLYPEPAAPFLQMWVPDCPDPDSYLRAAVSRLVPSWSHSTYSTLVDEAKQAMDQSKRMRLYAHAERILVEEVPILPLAYCGWHPLLQPWVKRFPKAEPFHEFWKDVVIEPH
jgi:ABC-type transport system substrate-binding protein